MDPEEVRARVHRRRSTQLKLMLGNQVDEDGAPLFEPEWEPQWDPEDSRTMLNAPDGADGTIALFYQLEEAGAEEAEDRVPLPAPAPRLPPGAADPEMKEILIRLVQAQAVKNIDSASISQRDATKVL